MDSTEAISIHLVKGSEVVLYLMCTIPKVLCSIGGYEITQTMIYWIMKNLLYNIILGMGWLQSTNKVIDCVVCSLEITVGNSLHAVLTLPVNSVASVTLSSLK